MISSRLATAALAGVIGLSVAAPRPALADGAASTRNILFGAAAVGGTLLIVNHNRKVHQKYAEYDRHQLEIESERNQAQAAYQSERSAYDREVALARGYRKQIAAQRAAIRYRDVALRGRDKQIASLKHSLIVAKYGASRRTAFVQTVPARPAAPRVRSVGLPASRQGPPRPAAIAARHDASAQTVSYGWGSF